MKVCKVNTASIFILISAQVKQLILINLNKNQLIE